ncbi:MAG: tRNA pseudouridine(38-40) synthase TruA [Candidatus Latescibacteria bacterium]|jgi:tRNA pseudouridine38-40 synthase|nr:tRNA pseudouridine(38-40) synthase TruA [Candidatus Latescibacterota bacterium]MBT4139924.1 tRNA pseudouridine(38-40) synthase TruA [Candidatus Latescibacterota bacterium]MBT5832494.1 tRNA pseudouridine(38-40) synthase TruA [Candidatus Latescibacterota bacterium]
MTRNIRLLVEYDGTHFHGWQIQPEQRTVQGEIQARLSKLFNESISVTASGRTDTGVHALGQVVNFEAPREITDKQLFQSLSSMLPPDIAIRKIDTVSPAFHARFDALQRFYFYRLSYTKTPFERYYTWYMHKKLDINTLNRAAQYLVGRHDFTSFCVAAHEKENRICEIYNSHWTEEEDGLVYHISGNRFLRSMVRSIVGTIVGMGRGVLSADGMPEILKAQDRQCAGESAPPCGLFLDKVVYADSLPGG